MSVIVLLVSVGGYALYLKYNGQINRIDLFGHIHGPRPAANADGPAVNFLLVGSDTRAGVSGNFAGGSAVVTGARSDTVILVHVPPGNGRATLISIPRDSWVQIPTYTDSHGQSVPAHYAKFNSAFSIGGPALLVQTVESLSGLRIDHYVQIDFVGFQNMVNALGGVTVCVGTSRSEPLSGDFLTAGIHHINGTQALAFVRDRHSFADQDFSRIKDQQYFLSVLLHTVLSAGTLVNPFKLNAFLDALTKSVTVDSGLSFDALRSFALRMRHLDPAHVQFDPLPVADGNAFREGQSVVLLDPVKMAALFHSLKVSTRTPARSASAKPVAPLIVAPSAIQVEVQNGTATAGLAHQVAQALASDGFGIAGVGNSATPDTGAPVVFYGPNRADSARTLAAAVPGSSLQLDPAVGNTVVLVVGPGYHGVQPVHVSVPSTSSTSSTSSTGSAAPSPPATAASLSCAP